MSIVALSWSEIVEVTSRQALSHRAMRARQREQSGRVPGQYGWGGLRSYDLERERQDALSPHLRALGRLTKLDPPPARTCQWIEGEGEPFGLPSFCNAPSVAGRSYCAHHASRVFRGADVRLAGRSAEADPRA